MPTIFKSGRDDKVALGAKGPCRKVYSGVGGLYPGVQTSDFVLAAQILVRICLLFEKNQGAFILKQGNTRP